MERETSLVEDLVSHRRGKLEGGMDLNGSRIVGILMKKSLSL
jgi:hypothetical protein